VPLYRISSAVEEYAQYLSSAQQQAQAYTSLAQTAQVTGDGALMRQAAQAGQDAQTAIDAWQQAGTRAAAEVRAAAGDLEYLFGKQGQVQTWINDQSEPELFSLAGIPQTGGPPGILGTSLAPEGGPGAEIYPVGPDLPTNIVDPVPPEIGPGAEIYPVGPDLPTNIVDPVPPEIGPGAEIYPIGPQGPLINYAKGGSGQQPGGNAGTGQSSETPKTKGEIDEQAALLGYSQKIPPQKAPFNSHGQPVYTNGKGYITPDVDQHNVTNGWKMFNRQRQRTGTYNWDLTTRVGG